MTYSTYVVHIIALYLIYNVDSQTEPMLSATCGWLQTDYVTAANEKQCTCIPCRFGFDFDLAGTAVPTLNANFLLPIAIATYLPIPVECGESCSNAKRKLCFGVLRSRRTVFYIICIRKVENIVTGVHRCTLVCTILHLAILNENSVSLRIYAVCSV